MKKQTAKHYRQGDVLITRVSSIPATAKRVEKPGRVILALGEATGHHHSLPENAATKYEDGPASYIEIAEALAMLEHQEHSTIELPRGKYRVTIQREYSPEAIRNVQD